MNNDSSTFPFEAPMDSCFDSNNDGQLSEMETAIRDAALYDSFEQTPKAFDDSNSGFSPSYSNYGKFENSRAPKNDNAQVVSDGVTTLVCFLVVAIIFGSIALCVAAENPIFLFVGTPIAIILLKTTGVMG